MLLSGWKGSLHCGQSGSALTKLQQGRTNPTIGHSRSSYLVEPPITAISTSDLIARQAVTLQKRPTNLEQIHTKVYDSRVKTIQRWEKEHANRILTGTSSLSIDPRTEYKVEYELSCKFKPRYLGLLGVHLKEQRRCPHPM